MYIILACSALINQQPAHRAEFKTVLGFLRSGQFPRYLLCSFVSHEISLIAPCKLSKRDMFCLESLGFAPNKELHGLHMFELTYHAFGHVSWVLGRASNEGVSEFGDGGGT